MGSKKALQIAFDCDPRTPNIATPRDTIAIAEFGAVSTQKSATQSIGTLSARFLLENPKTKR